jgi:hypothetical protein
VVLTLARGVVLSEARGRTRDGPPEGRKTTQRAAPMRSGPCTGNNETVRLLGLPERFPANRPVAFSGRVAVTVTARVPTNVLRSTPSPETRCRREQPVSRPPPLSPPRRTGRPTGGGYVSSALQSSADAQMPAWIIAGAPTSAAVVAAASSPAHTRRIRRVIAAPQSTGTSARPARMAGVAIEAVATTTAASRPAHRRRIRPVIVSSLVEVPEGDAGLDNGRCPDEDAVVAAASSPAQIRRARVNMSAPFAAAICCRRYFGATTCGGWTEANSSYGAAGSGAGPTSKHGPGILAVYRDTLVDLVPFTRVVEPGEPCHASAHVPTR